MAESTPSTEKELNDIREQIAEYQRPTEDSTVEERREFKAKMGELSKKAAELRVKQIEADTKLNADDKQILKLYNEGVQNYEIAKRVFKFVNQDTVGQVVLTIRKAHSDDWDAVEDINSTKGYTGVSR